MEDHEIIEAVEELRFEIAFRFLEDLRLHALEIGFVRIHRAEAERGLALDRRGADIRSHDDNRIAEIDLPTQRVGDRAVLEDLQEQVHHVRMGFLDLVEKHDRIRPAADGLGKLAAFLVADVTRRRSDQAAGGEFLHVFRHVDLNECLRVSKHELGEVACEIGFPDTRRAEEKERADGALRILEVGAGAAERLGNGDDRFVLADHAAFELVLHFQELFGLLLLHALQRHARPFRDDRHDVLVVHDDDLLLGGGAPCFERFLEVLLGLLFIVAEGGGFFEILGGNRGDLIAENLLDFQLRFLDSGWAGHRADAGARAGLVKDVDRLVGQVTGGEVAGGEFHGSLDGGWGVLRLVMRLVFVAQALEDEDRVLDGRLVYLDLLETALEGGVLLDVFAEFVERGCADALQLGTAKGGLDDVGSVHRAFRRTRADDRVQLVDEKDHVLHLADLVHDRLDALLELAAVFRARHHQREVEGDHALVAQKLRDVAGDDFLRQAFDDGGFANSGLTDQDGIVFRAAAKDLDHALDLALAADDGIEAAFLGEFREITSERFQRRGLGFALRFAVVGVGWAFVLEARHVVVIIFVVILHVVGGEIRINLGEDLVAGALDIDVEALEHAGGDPLALAQQAEQQVFGADVGMVECLRLLVGEREDFLHPRRVGDVSDSLLGRAGADLFLDFLAHGLQLQPHALEHVHGNALAELDQAEQQMFGADVGVVETVGLLTG